jgi:plastocyanin
LGLRPISDPEQRPGSIGVPLFGEVHFVKAGIRVGIAGVIVLLVGLAPTVVGASQRSSGKRQALASLVDVQRVRMVNFAFRPRSLSIPAGTKVRWVVREGTHSTTSNTGLWDSGVLSQGEAFGRVFRKAGTFKYHCTVHPSAMRGIITVT